MKLGLPVLGETTIETFEDLDFPEGASRKEALTENAELVACVLSASSAGCVPNVGVGTPE